MTPAKTARLLLALAIAMLSLSFLAVPFYDWFCRTTGFGGTTMVADEGSDLILDQTIRIRFDGTVESGLAWDFKPVERVMELRIGETGLAYFTAHNLSDRVIAGTASYNITPDAAGGYFYKIDCFCFTEQVLQPGETVDMPVSFYVDPEIVKDAEGRYVSEITLSYTFHETALPDTQAALDAAAPGAVN